MESNRKIEFYFNVLSRIDNNILIADGKALSSLQHLFAIITMFTSAIGIFLIQKDNFSINNLTGMQLFIVLMIILNIFLFINWYLACMKVIQPNTSNTKERSDDYVSVIFFNSINAMKLNEYVNKSKSLSKEDELDDLLKQIHIVSKIIDDKYKNFKKVQKWVLSSVVIFLFIILLMLSQFTGAN